MSTSDSKVVVDHVKDLSSAKEPILFLSFLFLQTDLFLEVGIPDDLVQRRCNSHVQHLKIQENEYNPELIAKVFLNHPPNRPTPLL